MNKKALPFYNSSVWRRARKRVLVRDNYLCQRCLHNGRLSPAVIVHHIEHLSEHPDKALFEENLESVCTSCHNKLHPEKGQTEIKPMKTRKARIIQSQANEEVT